MRPHGEGDMGKPGDIPKDLASFGTEKLMFLLSVHEESPVSRSSLMGSLADGEMGMSFSNSEKGSWLRPGRHR